MRALKKKGFRLVEGDHHFFVFYFNGKATGITTKFSHGSKYKDYRDDLFDLVKGQLKFQNNNDLIKFSKCTYTEEMYVKMLQDTGFLEKKDELADTQ
ncbi:hypothetical protein [Leptospira levettii]|uniref:Type II toxin-antitoxin system HicA family toxin n=1 Tax=Leptospira levettii TaxID=2023178 RepID=A0ABY2MU75_9LEPT|nr:hypothetical protein [Leptospira levettii]TGL75421.1 hypothetical protein EHQ60_00420 [Leptospira levettii]